MSGRLGGTVFVGRPRRRSKYRAVRTVVDGIRFDSKHEARCYRDLKLRERAGEIQSLERQPRFPIVVAGVHIGVYVADFRYVDCATGEVVIVDAKGVRTPVYKLKKRLVEALHPVQIQER